MKEGMERRGGWRGGEDGEEGRMERWRGGEDGEVEKKAEWRGGEERMDGEVEKRGGWRGGEESREERKNDEVKNEKWGAGGDWRSGEEDRGGMEEWRGERRRMIQHSKAAEWGTILQHTPRGWSILTTGEATLCAYLCHLACIQLGGVNWGRGCTVIEMEGNLLWSGETLPTNTAHCGV